MRSASEFIHEVDWGTLPEPVQRQARRCLLDTIAAFLGGRLTRLSAIARRFAAENYGGNQASLWLDGRQVSAPGAALANGMSIDALDIHDGHKLAKGHAGAAVIPASVAAIGLPGLRSWTGPELLAAVVVGYEVALRAAQSLHQTAADYHTSGAWNAVGCSAIVARRLGLDFEATRHALGIAEYHGPRSPMMRCIDHPSMLKDGSGWGAMAGVSAGLLAAQGFTGAPPELIEQAAAAGLWDDLGTRWLILEQYFKPFAVCRWAQPAVVGALELKARHSIDPAAITRIRIHTFHAAARLTTRHPANTEEAQYSLPFPVAAALVHGHLGPHELAGEALSNPLVLSLADQVEVIEDPELTARFPAERTSRVEILTGSGDLFETGPVRATWGADDPPPDKALRAKFRHLGRSVLAADRLEGLEAAIWQMPGQEDASILENWLAPQIGDAPGVQAQTKNVQPPVL